MYIMTSQPHSHHPRDDIEAFEMNRPPISQDSPLSVDEKLARIRDEFLRRPGIFLPDIALGRIVDLTPWTVRSESTPYGQERVLERQLTKFDKVEVPKDDDRRQIRRTPEGLEVRVKQAIGADVLFMLGIDSQFGVKKPKPQPEIPIDNSIDNVILIRSRFTKAQQTVLKHSTTHLTHEEIADEVGILSHSVGATLKYARKKLGVKSHEEAVLFAIGEGLASVDHIAEGMTDSLTFEQKEFMQNYYSKDENIRTATREMPLKEMAEMWESIYEALDLSTIRAYHKRLVAMMHGVRDGVIVPPPPLGMPDFDD